MGLHVRCRLVNDRPATSEFFNVTVPNPQATTTAMVATSTVPTTTTSRSSTTSASPSTITTTIAPASTSTETTFAATTLLPTTTTSNELSSTTTERDATTTPEATSTATASITTTTALPTYSATSTTITDTTTNSIATSTTVQISTTKGAASTVEPTTEFSTTTILTTTTTIATTTTVVFTPSQKDATLNSLLLINPNNDEILSLSQPFDPLQTHYNVTVTASMEIVKVQATTNSSSSYRLINGGSDDSIRLDYVLYPEGFTTVTIDVIAMSGNSRQYTVQIYRIPLTCNPPCSTGGGVCNGFKGECKCKTSEGFSGPLCDIYCPSSCSGHGTCNTTMKRCICDSTYGGPACDDRLCPSCLNNGVCVEKDFSCMCTPLWEGEDCSNKACVNKCNDVGDCVDGICKCFPGFKGDDCSVKETIKVPLDYAIEVQIVFGIAGYSSKNQSEPIMYPNFNLAASESQDFLHYVCSHSRNISSLNVRSEIKCWIEQFEEALTSSGYVFPLSPGMFSTALDLFLSANEGAALKAYKNDLGTDGSSESIQWTSLRMKINVDKTLNFQALNPVRMEWERFVKKISSEAPVSLGPALPASKTFTETDTEMGIIISTVVSFLTSNGISLACILFFTMDWKISGFTVLTINMIVVTLMGLMFWVAQYRFGAIEAVGVTIFVGMSVDYSLHLGHAYNHSLGHSRRSKLRDALSSIGVSIFGGAITTAGASFFLVWCRIFLFVQLGVMMLSNTVTAFVYTLICLGTCLAILGPVNKCICLRICRRPSSEQVHPDRMLVIAMTNRNRNYSDTGNVSPRNSFDFTYDTINPREV